VRRGEKETKDLSKSARRFTKKESVLCLQALGPGRTSGKEGTIAGVIGAGYRDVLPRKTFLVKKAGSGALCALKSRRGDVCSKRQRRCNPFQSPNRAVVRRTSVEDTAGISHVEGKLSFQPRQTSRTWKESECETGAGPKKELRIGESHRATKEHDARYLVTRGRNSKEGLLRKEQ